MAASATKRVIAGTKFGEQALDAAVDLATDRPG